MDQVDARQVQQEGGMRKKCSKVEFGSRGHMAKQRDAT